jgi:HEAT repeat protein
MHIRDLLSRPSVRAPLLGLALSLTAVWLAPPALAQRSNPVQALDRALSQPLDPSDKDASKRKETITKLVANLKTPGDMYLALLLPNWGDERNRAPSTLDDVAKEKAIQADRDVRKELLLRFLGEVKAAAKAPSPDTRAAIATLVGEFGASARGSFTRREGESNLIVLENLGEFVEPLANLAKDKDPEVRVAAARSLAKLRVDPKATVAALTSLLKDPDRTVRRAWAEAVGAVLRGTPAADRGTFTPPIIEPTLQNLVAFGPEVTKVTAGVLADRNNDTDVRVRCASALLQVASLLSSQLRGGTTVAPNVHKDLEPVMTALREHAREISGAVSDPDPEVRFLVLRALEELGDARYRWYHSEALPNEPRPEAAPERKPLGRAPAPADLSDLRLVAVTELAQPAGEAQDKVLAGVARDVVGGLKDPDARNRRAAVDTLEAITAHVPDRGVAEELGKGPAAQVARSLIRALSDQDPFVRWASARTLGKMAPLDGVEDGATVERGAVAALARALCEEDPDVRLRVAGALEKFGSAAQPAVPALARAASVGDVEARIIAAHAIAVIGGHPEEAVPALAAGLTDPNVRLRRAVAEALSRYGADARAARPALQRALWDTDPEVRRLASDALLSIGSGNR